LLPGFPDFDGRRQLSLWSRDGRELLFQTHQCVMAVSYTAQRDSFAAGKPRMWTETRLRNVGIYSNYDLAPDGNPLTHLTFLLNFFDELRRRAPASK